MKTYIWNNLSEVERKNILLRPLLTQSETIKKQVNDIVAQVKLEGDEALFKLTTKYDRVSLNDLKVNLNEFNKAFDEVSLIAKEAILFSKKQLEANHLSQFPKNQMVETCKGVFCERQVRPIGNIGLYIPGGETPLVSTVLMLGVPSQIAGCPVRILCTPPNAKGEVDSHILVAAKLCGIESVYKVGGAQAIAAMAYGTKTIPKVDKIFGPGNKWVTQAKVEVAQDPQGASIDMPAGPSEVMVIADEYANPEYVAADLLSQAEHDVDSQVMLVTLSEKMASQVKSALENQLIELPRKNIVEQSLANSRIIIAKDVEQAIVISNFYAPEHLILQFQKYERYIKEIKNAGTVFLGQWSPEVAGDYVTGSNHVLPTSGYARSYSGLSVTDFMKFITFQRVTKEGLEAIGLYAKVLADIEGLKAHNQAVCVRLGEEVVCE